MNKNSIKKIAFYLPQFYEFKENNEWWGNGFTEWTNVKKSKPLFKGHYQPTIPLNNFYYSLNDIDTLKWQVGMAKQYGLDGFCFYHYWFGNGRQLMEKPVDMFLTHKEITFPFCLCWANHNWSRTWVGGDKELLMEMKYGGEEEWNMHMNYLIPFFKDPRYIKIDNKPLFVIYMPQSIPNLEKLIDFYKKKAIENGLDGIIFLAQNCFQNRQKFPKIDFFINYEPNYSLQTFSFTKKTFFYSASYTINRINYAIRGLIKRISHGKLCKVRTYNYSGLWSYILKRPFGGPKEIAGAFVRCDVTPRRQDRAIIVKGDSPILFKRYLSKLYKKIKDSSNMNYVFISAWNEWGEGMYLEPDEKNRYGYLEAIKDADQDND